MLQLKKKMKKVTNLCKNGKKDYKLPKLIFEKARNLWKKGEKKKTNL